MIGNNSIFVPNGKIIAGPLEAKEGILYADFYLQEIIKAKRILISLDIIQDQTFLISN